MTDEELRALGKDLPFERPDASRREAVRSALVVGAAAARDARPARPWWLAGGGFVAGAAAAAVLVVWLMRRDATPHEVEPALAIEASAQANFEREVTHGKDGTDEIVRLHGGKLRLAVGKLATGDHVRVRTGDAEVEGAGEYEVVADATGEKIREVVVTAGSAKVTVDGQQAVFLAAGQTWNAPVVTATLDVHPDAQIDDHVDDHANVHVDDQVKVKGGVDVDVAVKDKGGAHVDARVEANANGGSTTLPAIKSTLVATTDADKEERDRKRRDDKIATIGRSESTVFDEPAKPPTGDTPSSNMPSADKPTVTEPKPADTKHAAIEHYFEAGYALLREGKADDAARELAAAADLDPDDALAGDARYFEAVALVKAKRPAEAEKALVAFLDHAKTSLRRGRASVMLARLLADRGDTKSARAWFEAATADADAGVVGAARAGLSALGN